MTEHFLELLSVVFGTVASIFIIMDYMGKIFHIIIIVIIGSTKNNHKKIKEYIFKNLKIKK